MSKNMIEIAEGKKSKVGFEPWSPQRGMAAPRRHRSWRLLPCRLHVDPTSIWGTKLGAETCYLGATDHGADP